MPLLDDNLTLWKISFRWAGLDPDALKYRFYIPTSVKDNIRLLTQAIITNVLWCKSLRPDPLLAPDSNIERIRADKFYDCFARNKYDHDFLKSHTIYRSDFALWCNRLGIPFPEFWFPAGWVVHELNEKDWLAETDTRKPENTVLVINREPILKLSGKRVDAKEEVWKPARVAAQTIWDQEKSLTISDVVRRIKSNTALKASSLTESAIRKHIADLSPTPGKPGRKPSKKLT
ncbi:MAG TPA: hypothetical protein VIO39_07495 [Methylotenera sp.]